MTKLADQRFVEAHIEGKRLFLQITGQKGETLFGTRVTRGGETFWRSTKEADEMFVFVFNKANVLREMRMDLHYGRLEPIGSHE